MKLYTELELRKAINLYMNNDSLLFVQVLAQLTPIELPSDEDIDNMSYSDEQHIGFRIGAKWMKEQILNQNK